MDKKIGIVTIFGNDNYGNRLQNYALETSIKKMGFEVETLVIEEPGEKIRIARRSIKRLFSSKSVKERFRARKLMTKKKEQLFRRFTNEYLNNVNYKYYDDFSNFSKIFVGSDQVWNPNFDLRKVYFLRFVDKEKRYSYAASIATESVPSKKKKTFVKYLNGMNNISVREETSVALVKNLTGRLATCVLDPTLLLSKEEYMDLIESSSDLFNHTKRRYVLIYCLSELEVNLKKEIEKYAKKNALEIIQIMGNYYNENHVVYDPIGFLDAINNARLVITDSFHCGVFSIIMESSFTIVERSDGAKMNSRLESLLKTVGLEKQKYRGQKLSTLDDLSFDEANRIIEERANFSFKYLKDQLSME